MDTIRQLDLNTLKEGLPGVTKELGAYHVQACLVCFKLHQHLAGTYLDVKGTYACRFRILFTDIVTDQIERTLKDVREATELGACGIAFLLVLALTKYTVIERSRIGTGFDYYLGYRDTLIFDNAARLEVSGINKAELESAITQRVKEKLEQTKRSDGSLPAYVVVVEFSTPVSYVVKK